VTSEARLTTDTSIADGACKPHREWGRLTCNLSKRCAVKPSVVMWSLFVIVQLVSSVSGFAQADSAVSLQRTSLTAVRRYVPVRDTRENTSVPANLIVSPVYQALLESMLVQSPSFRRQCQRIAAASHLTVLLMGDAGGVQTETRAVTTISRERDGELRAVIRIKQADRATELIAHELEHVIEQLDGIDLKSLAALETSGVRQCRCAAGAFETDRAVFAGRRVAQEIAARGR
jgi:hypothetical protein